MHNSALMKPFSPLCRRRLCESLYHRPDAILEQNLRRFRSSAKATKTLVSNSQKAHSSTTSLLDQSFASSASSASSTTAAHATTCRYENSNVIPRPSLSDLRVVFTASAVPMVGFGFMDNMVMIQAGQYIDSTIGVQLGLATLTAAACGQVVSDVSGVVFGGTLERTLSRLGLIQVPKLSHKQRQLPLVRNVSMAGAVIGVIIGCALGATTLLFCDLETRTRIDRGIKLREIVSDMVHATQLPVQHCTLYIADQANYTIPPDSYQDGKIETKLYFLNDATEDAVRDCVSSRDTLVGPDGILYTPVIDHRTNHVVAVMALEKKGGNDFVESNFVSARILAGHLAIFMDRIAEK